MFSVNVDQIEAKEVGEESGRASSTHARFARRLWRPVDPILLHNELAQMIAGATGER